MTCPWGPAAAPRLDDDNDEAWELFMSGIPWVYAGMSGVIVGLDWQEARARAAVRDIPLDRYNESRLRYLESIHLEAVHQRAEAEAKLKQKALGS